MPVDPGNLLVLGKLGGKTRDRRARLRAQPQGERLRLGARPAARRARCHRERHRRHGRRRAADGNPDAAAAARSRCRPRASRRSRDRALAAGRSSRMGGPNKLLARFDGDPLVRRAVERALASKAVGYDRSSPAISASACARRLSGLDVAFVDNPDFADGLVDLAEGRVSRCLPDDIAGVLIVLGDMPGVGVRRSRPADRRVPARPAASRWCAPRMRASAATR